METKTKISELETIVKQADTATVEGRQAVANACKELYKTIEQDVHTVGVDWMLNGMYQDLCTGNFAEPFMCERKKTDFLTVVSIYGELILPNL
jgi:hypothetical protein